jgi:hypothetical protein
VTEESELLKAFREAVWKVQVLDDGLTTTSVTEFTDRQEAMKAAGAVNAGAGNGR